MKHYTGRCASPVWCASDQSSITLCQSNSVILFFFKSLPPPWQAGVLTKNGYLRLDPAVMHVSCNHAGILLARFGRPEVQNCIEGLEQYSYSYEEAAEQAQELRRLFALARAGQMDFMHMTSAVLRQQQHPHTQHQQQQQPTQAPPQEVHSQGQSGLGDGMYVDAATF